VFLWFSFFPQFLSFFFNHVAVIVMNDYLLNIIPPPVRGSNQYYNRQEGHYLNVLIQAKYSDMWTFGGRRAFVECLHAVLEKYPELAKTSAILHMAPDMSQSPEFLKMWFVTNIFGIRNGQQTSEEMKQISFLNNTLEPLMIPVMAVREVYDAHIKKFEEEM
jgi:hypothetical protein